MGRISTGVLALALAMAVPLLTERAVATDSIPELDLRVGPDTRLLVLAPHPDDESLGAAGLVQRVITAGGSVRVALMTSGDAFPEGVEMAMHVRRPRPQDFRVYGRERERETITTMQVIGVSRAHILFLGFPDGGLCLIAAKYLTAKGRAFQSPFTGRVEPPESEQVVRGVTYRGTDVRRELEALVLAYQPTLLALPHPEDHHPEHCATSIFAREALDVIRAQARHGLPRVLYYVIHYAQWPNLDDDPTSPFLPPPGFPTTEGHWRSLTLTAREAALKSRAMNAYVTQELIIGRFLRAFARPNELFLEGPVPSPPECWCDDTHVATEAPPDRYRHQPERRP